MLRFKSFNKLKNIIEDLKRDSLGISREDMPQIAGDKMEEFKEFLKSKNITWDEMPYNPKLLRPIQNEFNIEKVKNMLNDNYSGTILVSSDDYILDGHHRFICHLHDDKPIMVRKLSTNVKECLKTFHDFHGVFYKGV